MAKVAFARLGFMGVLNAIPWLLDRFEDLVYWPLAPSPKEPDSPGVSS